MTHWPLSSCGLSSCGLKNWPCINAIISLQFPFLSYLILTCLWTVTLYSWQKSCRLQNQRLTLGGIILSLRQHDNDISYLMCYWAMPLISRYMLGGDINKLNRTFVLKFWKSSKIKTTARSVLIPTQSFKFYENFIISTWYDWWFHYLLVLSLAPRTEHVLAPCLFSAWVDCFCF